MLLNRKCRGRSPRQAEQSQTVLIEFEIVVRKMRVVEKRERGRAGDLPAVLLQEQTVVWGLCFLSGPTA